VSAKDAVALVVQVGPKRAERVFGLPLGGDRFRLASIPFLAVGMSLGDVVTASEGRVTDVVEKGGHATLRVRFTDFLSADEFQKFWPPFAALGCVCESTSQGLIAIDVPPRTDRSALAGLLAPGRSAGDFAVEIADGAFEIL